MFFLSCCRCWCCLVVCGDRCGWVVAVVVGVCFSVAQTLEPQASLSRNAGVVVCTCLLLQHCRCVCERSMKGGDGLRPTYHMYVESKDV